MTDEGKLALAIRLIEDLGHFEYPAAPRHRPDWYEGKQAALRLLKAIAREP